jgi:hypothetical protein
VSGHSPQTQKSIDQVTAFHEQQAAAFRAEREERAREVAQAEKERQAHAYQAGIAHGQAKLAYEEAQSRRDDVIVAAELGQASDGDVDRAWAEEERARRRLHAAVLMANHWRSPG